MRAVVIRRAAWTAAVLLALALWGFSWASVQGLAAVRGTATLHLKAPVAAQAYSEMRRTEERTPAPRAFALWRQTDSETVEGLGLSRKTEANILALRGDSRLVLPAAPLLSEEDFSGCLLDAQTAYELFGNENAAGESVVYDGKAYVVRGVFQSPKATVVVQHNGGGFSKIALETGGEASAAAEFAMRQRVQPAFTVSGGLYESWALAFARLPAWVFGGALLFFLLRAARRQREYPVRAALLAFAAVAVTAAYFWAAGLQISVPQSLVPTRWSDFEFWLRTWNQLGAQAFELFRMKKDQPEVYCLAIAAKSIFSGAGASALFLAGCIKAAKVRAAKVDTELPPAAE